MGYITACDTHTQVVVIFIDGGYQLAFISAIGHIEFMVAFHDTPAVVAAFYDDVYFFIFVLAYITRKKLFGALVKRDAPGVAQAIGPYFRAYAVAYGLPFTSIRMILPSRVLRSCPLPIVPCLSPPPPPSPRAM